MADGFFTVSMNRAVGRKSGGGAIGGAIGGAMDEDVSEKQMDVLRLITEQPRLSLRKIAETLGINASAVQKHLDALKAKGVIERMGGTRGHWKVKR